MATRRNKRIYRLALMDADRRNLGLTFTAIAAEIGMGSDAVSKFFRGKNRSPRTAKRIAIALGHPVSRYVISPVEPAPAKQTEEGAA